MVKNVDLISYLPPYLQEYKEDVAALAAENPEFLLVWNAVDRILYNHFIETADSYGISRFEKLLGIYPSESDTLESRRSRVKIQWVNLLPYTMKTLLQKLNVLCGENSYTISHNFRTGYTLSLITHLDKYGQTEELNNLLQEMLPANIVIDSTNQIICTVRTDEKFGARLATKIGVIITHDFCETDRITLDARAASAAGSVEFIEIKDS